ncbi:MAG: hypothetical protein AAFY88_02160 [Acidobacteriota bacterium]
MSLRNGVISFALTSLFALSPAFGLCGDVCEISIREDALAVSLPLEGWLYSQGANVQVTLIEPPIFGTWLLETYTPSDDFLMAGGDRLRFEVYDVGTGTRERHTVLINLGTGISPAFAEDFETVPSVADLNADFQVDGQAQMSLVTDPVTGDRGLRVSVSGSGLPASLGELSGPVVGDGDGRNSARIVGVVNASPPDDPFSFSFLQPFVATVLELGDLAYTQLQYTAANGYEFRAVGGPGLTCGGVCTTQWRSVQAGHDYRIRLSFGRNAFQHPDGTNRYNLEVRYRDLDGTWQAEDLLEDVTVTALSPVLPLAPSFGLFDTSGVGQVELTYGEVEAAAGFLLPSTLGAQVEDFSGGVWSPNWTSTGPVATSLVAPASGASASTDWEGVVTLFGVANNGRGWWSDTRPDSSSTLWAHLRVDFDRLKLPKWGSFIMLEGRTPTDVRFLELWTRSPQAGTHQIQLRSRDGSGAFQSTGWIGVPATAVDIDVAWDGAKGSLDLWLDGQIEASLDMLPGPYRIDEVGFGIRNLSLNGMFVEVFAGLYVDDVVLQYD